MTEEELAALPWGPRAGSLHVGDQPTYNPEEPTDYNDLRVERVHAANQPPGAAGAEKQKETASRSPKSGLHTAHRGWARLLLDRRSLVQVPNAPRRRARADDRYYEENMMESSFHPEVNHHIGSGP